ncbi:hypothetical protein M413DRAFT_440477 [Hebeloma cylindrosporum]|uniref:Uncharacterized protein n=1 Tax=Hebeloma cylindrosporum TaxID=76867 RepID=A0A0C2Z159_HEBCY|nr:hypothetical protein M413DRAFT_440477 [Hebeloma cylindrosporum h7]
METLEWRASPPLGTYLGLYRCILPFILKTIKGKQERVQVSRWERRGNKNERTHLCVGVQLWVLVVGMSELLVGVRGG